MNNTLFTAKMKFADVLLINNNLILMLSRFGIALGFGDKNVDEVCRQYHVSTKFFLLLSNVYTFEDYLPTKSELMQIDMKEMIPYLLASHDYYLNERLQVIEQNMQIITQSCSLGNGAVLQRFFSEYKEEVIKHFRYEEETVFPYIKNLLRGEKSTAYNIHQFEENHSNIEDKLTDLINILIKYLPSELCQNERISVLSDIFILSADLSKHALIEEKILAPYVETLEENGSK
ncbi:MAG: hemerythrin domain-containing protein [Bacteroidales bacterium]|nr:hemerythrin domain-containing protein [Bacteroidales bacterium]